MQETRRLEFMGMPGSPYTRKMIGVLRYRHIPYSVFMGENKVPEGYPKPKVSLLPTFYFPDGEDGTLIPVTDSTPIIRKLEEDYKERSIIPSNPALSFLNNLVEDYADEWLTKAMFHFRWAHERNWKEVANWLVFSAINTAPEEMASSFVNHFSKRQIERLYVVGSNEVTAETIEASYTRLVRILDKLIAQRGFIFGARPSSADFALFGQLTQLASVEPSSTAMTLKLAPRVRAWVDLMEDQSGLQPKEEDWSRPEEVRGALAPLLAEIGHTYTPAMIANAKAIRNGDDTFETEIDNRHWTQPVFKYQAKCLQWLRDDYAALSQENRDTVNSLLSGTGCEILFE